MQNTVNTFTEAQCYLNINIMVIFDHIPGRVAPSVTCLATDASLTADPGVVSSIPTLVPYFHGD